jgi:hypothetical protein
MTRLALFAMIAACGGGSSEQPGQRYLNRAQGYSLEQPDGWAASDDHGSTKFTPPNGGKHTIIVRSAARPAEIREGQPATNADIFAATSRVLRGMPRANLGAPTLISGTELPGALFTVTFFAGSAQRMGCAPTS